MIIAVDYDNTLDGAGYPFVGKPFLDRIEKIKKLREEGNEIILWTCRHGQTLEVAVQYMKTFGLEFDAINENVKRYSNGYNSPKVIADVYIDDCGCGSNTWEDFFNTRDNKRTILF